MGILFVARCLDIKPAVVFAVVHGIGLVGPAVGDRAHPGHLRVFYIETERAVGFAGLVGLEPNLVFVRKLDRPWVVEAADAL
ncbi:hypothetical protein D3C87_2037260 [compost metagenome]